jgi:hypothetical protein
LKGEGGLHGFECFLADVGLRPSNRHSIGRIENDDGYRPGNVEWQTQKQQMRNTRVNRRCNAFDLDLSLAEAVERFGAVSYQTATMRIHCGWRSEDAVLTPKGEAPTTLAPPF